MNAEGWYLDPYEAHEQRWFSDGRPTALVRDDAVEAHDEPPAHAYPEPLVAAPEHDADGTDLLRADAATSEDQSVTQADGVSAALGAFGSSGVGYGRSDSPS